MRELKTIIFITCGMLFGYFFEEEIQSFQYYDILYPSLFALVMLGTIYNKQKIFRQRTFVKAKYDNIKQVVRILIGITITVFTLYYWIPISYFHWMFLLIGVGAVLNNIFYESTIQLYMKNDELYVQYSNSSYFNFSKIDSFNLEDETLKIHFDETRVEVYKVKMEQSNIEKLTGYLSEFQLKKNANKR